MKPNITNFHYHRAGWNTATHVISNMNWPISVYDWLEYQIKIGIEMKSPWIGFLHSALQKPQGEYSRYGTSVASVSEIVHNPLFVENLKTCRGLYTLTRHTTEFLKRHVAVPVENLWHPVEPVRLEFDYESWKENKRVVTIGQWMRRIHSLCDVNVNYEKLILSLQQFGINDYNEMSKFTKNLNTVKFLGYQSNEDYDKMLSNTVVFLDLYDVAACNVILECIIRNTPICINLLPATVEYLGCDYPLYYQTIKEASEKLSDEQLIKAASYYLRKMDKRHLSPGMFAKSINDSHIYRRLHE
jgi:hypothetical protein